MPELNDPRVAVYIDFDNIVISQYDNVHERGAFTKDKARFGGVKAAGKLEVANVNFGAILDFASSFGSLAIIRAYADWSAFANNRYRNQLVERAVDLVQLFNTSGTKNGADIRLAIDVVDDLSRLADISHIVIVAGDSDYIPLAQRAKRLGRTVVGIGVANSTSEAFKNAVDEFRYYADLVVGEPAPDTEPEPEQSAVTKPTVAKSVEAPDRTADPRKTARNALRTALRVSQITDEDGWVNASPLKQQMKRLDTSFDEKKIGFKSFTDFLKAEKSLVELHEDGLSRRVRLRDRG